MTLKQLNLVSFVLTGLAGWVVGKLESNAKLNSKVEVEVEVGVELCKIVLKMVTIYSTIVKH